MAKKISTEAKRKIIFISTATTATIGIGIAATLPLVLNKESWLEEFKRLYQRQIVSSLEKYLGEYWNISEEFLINGAEGMIPDFQNNYIQAKKTFLEKKNLNINSQTPNFEKKALDAFKEMEKAKELAREYNRAVINVNQIFLAKQVKQEIIKNVGEIVFPVPEDINSEKFKNVKKEFDDLVTEINAQNLPMEKVESLQQQIIAAYSKAEIINSNIRIQTIDSQVRLARYKAMLKALPTFWITEVTLKPNAIKTSFIKNNPFSSILKKYSDAVAVQNEVNVSYQKLTDAWAIVNAAIKDAIRYNLDANKANSSTTLEQPASADVLQAFTNAKQWSLNVVKSKDPDRPTDVISELTGQNTFSQSFMQFNFIKTNNSNNHVSNKDLIEAIEKLTKLKSDAILMNATVTGYNAEYDGKMGILNPLLKDHNQAELTPPNKYEIVPDDPYIEDPQPSFDRLNASFQTSIGIVNDNSKNTSLIELEDAYLNAQKSVANMKIYNIKAKIIASKEMSYRTFLINKFKFLASSSAAFPQKVEFKYGTNHASIAGLVTYEEANASFLNHINHTFDPSISLIADIEDAIKNIELDIYNAIKYNTAVQATNAHNQLDESITQLGETARKIEQIKATIIHNIKESSKPGSSTVLPLPKNITDAWDIFWIKKEDNGNKNIVHAIEWSKMSISDIRELNKNGKVKLKVVSKADATKRYVIGVQINNVYDNAIYEHLLDYVGHLGIKTLRNYGSSNFDFDKEINGVLSDTHGVVIQGVRKTVTYREVLVQILNCLAGNNSVANGPKNRQEDVLRIMSVLTGSEWNINRSTRKDSDKPPTDRVTGKELQPTDPEFWTSTHNSLMVPNMQANIYKHWTSIETNQELEDYVGKILALDKNISRETLRDQVFPSDYDKKTDISLVWNWKNGRQTNLVGWFVGGQQKREISDQKYLSNLLHEYEIEMNEMAKFYNSTLISDAVIKYPFLKIVKNESVRNKLALYIDQFLVKHDFSKAGAPGELGEEWYEFAYNIIKGMGVLSAETAEPISQLTTPNPHPIDSTKPLGFNAWNWWQAYRPDVLPDGKFNGHLSSAEENKHAVDFRNWIADPTGWNSNHKKHLIESVFNMIFASNYNEAIRVLKTDLFPNSFDQGNNNVFGSPYLLFYNYSAGYLGSINNKWTPDVYRKYEKYLEYFSDQLIDYQIARPNYDDNGIQPELKLIKDSAIELFTTLNSTTNEREWNQEIEFSTYGVKIWDPEIMNLYFVRDPKNPDNRWLHFELSVNILHGGKYYVRDHTTLPSAVTKEAGAGVLSFDIDLKSGNYTFRNRSLKWGQFRIGDFVEGAKWGSISQNWTNYFNTQISAEFQSLVTKLEKYLMEYSSILSSADLRDLIYENISYRDISTQEYDEIYV